MRILVSDEIRKSAMEWAKKNRKVFVDEVFDSVDRKLLGPPVAVFMAGLPGAGKTEFSKSLYDNITGDVLRLDMDAIAAEIPSYTPETADCFREAATYLLNKMFDKIIDKKISFILDGTFGSKNALLDVDRILKRGYNLKIVYIVQEPDVAWNNTVAREKVEHRSIVPTGFIETYYRMINNLRVVLRRGDSDILMDIVIKNRHNGIKRYISNIDEDMLNKVIGSMYSREELEKVVYEGKEVSI